MKQYGDRIGINFFDRMTAVCQNPDGELVFVNTRNVNELLESGMLYKDSILFNNLIDHIHALDAEWRKPLAASWLSNFIQSQITSNN